MQSYYEYTEDLLLREGSARKFVDDFLDTSLNCVIGLNSEYGSGKSVFIELCANYINKNKNTESILINAAENEFEDNPSFTILNGIISKINKNNDTTEIEVIGRLLLDMTAKENITLGSDTLSIENYLMKDRGRTKEQFKYKMESFLSDKKIIVFLDDLDRCSPYFAIRILEELKYYFKFIKGITFVIAYDRKQLESFIRVKFGNDIDTNGYLAKFFDLRYFFKSVEKDKFIKNLFNKCATQMSCEDLSDKFKIISDTIGRHKNMLEFLSLRDLQQLVLKIVKGLSRCREFSVDLAFSNAIALLSYLRVLDWELYMELYRERITGDEAINSINKNNYFKSINKSQLNLLNEGKGEGNVPIFPQERLRLVFEVLENDREK